MTSTVPLLDRPLRIKSERTGARRISCPECGSDKTGCRDGRPAELLDSRTSFRRRRFCENGHKFWTLEIIESELQELIEARAQAMIRMEKMRNKGVFT